MSRMNVVLVFLIHVLEWAFAIGMIGSAIVVLWTSVEDVEVVLEREKPLPPEPPEENIPTD
jgi:hypothetical protein